MRRSLLVVLLLVFTAAPNRPIAAADPAAPDFVRDVRPILTARCFSCHDRKKGMSGFRLDQRDGAFKGGESGVPAIVRGKPDESELIRRITSREEGVRMPPEGDAVPESEVAVLRAWISAGAAWPDELAGDDSTRHWAFHAPTKPALPEVSDAAWVRNDIDRFIEAKLDREGLKPAAQADRVTLLRRLSLDLIGLPPTIEEVDAFLADESDGAYERAVDRLLESPHYGERWGRIWLDAARYADSDGYEKDKPRYVWFFRDWVIGALNRDLPYDQFVIEQIAGDQLPNPTQDQRVATGFLRNSMINEEGGIDPEQFRMEAMFDRMDAIGKAMLGLTIQCAQCHNHKYDPISQEEYYKLFAFINDSHEANITVYTPPEQMARGEIFRHVAEIEAALKEKMPDWAEKMQAWEDSVRGNQPEWTVLTPIDEDLTTGGQKYVKQADGSLLAQGYAPTKHTAAFRAPTDLKTITGFQVELLNDPNLPRNGPGRSILGTAALTDFSAAITPNDHPEQGREIKIAKATADVNLPEKELDKTYDDKSGKRRVTGPIAYAIDGDSLTAWGTDAGPGLRNQPRKAVFVPDAPVENPNGATLTVRLLQMHGGWNSDDNQNHNLGRFRLSVTSAPDPVADPLPKIVRDILSIPREQRTTAQADAVFSYWRTTVPEWADANRQIDESWKTHPEGATQLAMISREGGRTTQILKRGDFLNPVHPVEAGTPAFLHPLPEGAPRTRLTFAKWLVDRNSPTAARSIVNRVWQAYFGTGLVSTSEDLGMQAETPSHPELLDWLAVDFMDRGWSLKSLHRLIVTSATYRQASNLTPDQFARDPYNRLLARGPRLRVDAEIVRDVALSASGLLSPTVGGPSVFPPLPEFMLLPPASYGPKIWPTSEGADRYRRALYTFRYRSIPYPALQVFDAPNGDFACVRRSRSNTPLQALTTLNEPVFIDCARGLAQRTVKSEAANDRDKLTYAFRLCTSRQPTEEESRVLLELLEGQKQHFAQHEPQAWELASADVNHKPELPAGMTAADLAAWTAVSRVLLNLDETITKE